MRIPALSGGGTGPEIADAAAVPARVDPLRQFGLRGDEVIGSNRLWHHVSTVRNSGQAVPLG